MDLEQEITTKEQLEKETKGKVESAKIALQEILKTRQGRVFVKFLFAMSPLEFDTFSTDSLRMAYNCGRKSITLELYDFIKSNFEKDTMSLIENEEF